MQVRQEGRDRQVKRREERKREITLEFDREGKEGEKGKLGK